MPTCKPTSDRATVVEELKLTAAEICSFQPLNHFQTDSPAIGAIAAIPGWQAVLSVCRFPVAFLQSETPPIRADPCQHECPSKQGLNK